MPEQAQTCRWCGKVLEINKHTPYGRQRYCSTTCRVNARRFHQRYPYAPILSRSWPPAGDTCDGYDHPAWAIQRHRNGEMDCVSCGVSLV